MTDALPLLKATHTSCCCPVCLDVFKDPVSFHCGHVLCRACAIRCITARPRCPLCNQSVPNARHLVPLPQLALFCVLSREVGLRLPPPPSLQAPAPQAESKQESNAHNSSSVVPPSPFREAELQVGTDGETAGGDELSPSQSPHQRRRTENAPLQLAGSAITWAMPPANLPELPQLANAGETQRLPSESSEEASTPRSAEDEQPPLLFNGEDAATVSCGGENRKEMLNAPDLFASTRTSTPPTSTSSSTATSTAPQLPRATEPISPTLAMLQARFAEEAEQLESTPRLPTATSTEDEATAPDVANGAPAHTPTNVLPVPDVKAKEEEEEAAADAPWWRLWRRGHGAVRCVLVPPAVRVQLASREKAATAQNSSNVEGKHQLQEVVCTEAVAAAAAAVGERKKSSHNSASTTLSRHTIKKTATLSIEECSDSSGSLTSSEVTRLHRAGCCALCGLDVTRRTVVRHRLQRLLHSAAAACDRGELAAQTEDGLALLLGPLWTVRCTVLPDSMDLMRERTTTATATTSTASAVGATSAGSTAAPYTAAEMASESLAELNEVCEGISATSTHRRGGSAKLVEGLAHHNCLAWAGLLDVYTDTSSAPSAASIPTTTTLLRLSVPLRDPFEVVASHASGRVARWQLLAASLWHAAHVGSKLREGVRYSGGDKVTRHARTRDEEEFKGAYVMRRGPRCVLCNTPSTVTFTVGCGGSGVLDLFGVGLRTCEGTERGESSCGRQFHYPCALLAGATACLAYGLEDEENVLTAANGACVREALGVTAAVGGGSKSSHPVEVWCGSCHERHELRRRSRSK